MTERILILNVSGIGDFVDSTPALRYARRMRPGSKLSLMVSEKVYPLAKNCPYMDEVISVPTSAGRSIPRLNDVPRWLKQILPLRAQFDVALNLYDVASRGGAGWVRFLLAWSGAALTIGSNLGGLAPFYDRRIENQMISLNQIERSLRILSLLDPSVPQETQSQPELWIEPRTIESSRKWVRSLPGSAVAVFLGGERRTRHEKPVRAEAWLAEIQRLWRVHPILIGTASDPGLPSNTQVKHTDLRGKSSLEETASIIASCSALITTHSSPQHFATVWNVPTVVLVGPGDDNRYRPHLGAGRLRMLRNAVSCSPCYYQDCPLQGSERQKCMTGIPIDSIVQAFSHISSHN
jgi:ADP-heptose:LPS heptosyltransferase